MIILKKSTASQEVPLGIFVDSTDGNSEETGLTIANTDIKLWKAGATTLANKNSGGATHISNGIYYATLDATDTDTEGSLVIFVHVSGALYCRLECMVLPAKVYDSLIAGSDNLEVDSIQMGGTALTARDIGASVLLSPGTGTGQVNLSSGAVPCSDKTGFSLSTAGISAIWDHLLTAITTTGSIGKLIKDYLDAAISSRLATAGYTAPPTKESIRGEIDSNSTQLAAIVADTNELQAEMSDGGRTDLLIDGIKAKTDMQPVIWYSP